MAAAPKPIPDRSARPAAPAAPFPSTSHADSMEGRGARATGPVGWLSEVFASFQGEGSRAGQRHLFVRFAGCNIRCTWCDTPDSLVKVGSCTVDYPRGGREVLENPIAPGVLARVVERFLDEDPSIAMVAITGGEPMVQAGFLAAWLASARPRVGTLLETNAIVTSGLAAVLDGVDLVSADVKLPSNSGEGDLWERHGAFLEACRGKDLYVKVPVDGSTDEAEVSRAAALVAGAAPGATLYLTPIADPDSGAWRVEMPRLARLAALAAVHVPDTRVLPQIHKLTGVR